jgi:hypothetical protein
MMKKTVLAGKRYSKCAFVSCAKETDSLSCGFVETFDISTYFCIGRQLSINLLPHFPESRPFTAIAKGQPDKIITTRHGKRQHNTRRQKTNS